MLKNLFSLMFLSLFFMTQNISAQSLVSSGFNQAGSGTAILSYTNKSYTKFYAGEAKMDAPMGGLDQSIVSLYTQYSITDRIQLVASLPYLSNTSKDGAQEFDGIQGVSIFAKGKAYGNDKISLGAAVGAHLAADYNAAALYSLGNGSSAVDGLALFQYKLPAGITLDLQAGYSIKTDEDVPNAAMFVSKLAYQTKFFYASASYGIQRSKDGLDIGGENFGGPVDFPNTKVDYDEFILSVYVPVSKVFALTGYYGTVIDGRNIGDANYFGLGVAVNWSKDKE